MSEFNKTSLDVDKALERGIIHRDYLAHSLRWSHIMRHVKKIKGRRMNLLDVGCGEHYPLLKTLYTNKKLAYVNYVGLDIKKIDVNMNFGSYNESFRIIQADVVNDFPHMRYEWEIEWDIITCFEMIEHMDKDDGIVALENIQREMSSHTNLFLSTPCFNGKAAGNHIYEWEYEELKKQLESMFDIVAHYGTFASQKDIVPVLDTSEFNVFSDLKDYYDSNVISALFAPLHPAQSRNVIWHLKLKED